jgi:hypothetical protein
MEHATGTSWTNSSSAYRPVTGWQVIDVGGTPTTFLALTYRRNDAADGVNCRVQFSTSLGSWNSAPSAVTYVSTVNNGDGTSTVTCRATQPASSSTRQFLRLTVTP